MFLILNDTRSYRNKAVPIWAEAVYKRIYRTGIEAAYMRSALRVISAFRTVSTDAAVVIAGMMLLKLVKAVEKRKHNTSRGIDLLNPDQIVDDVIDKWQ